MAFSKYSAAIYFFGQEFWLEFFCWQLLTFDLLKLATPRIRLTTRVEFWSKIYSYFDQTKIDDHRFFQECQQNFWKKMMVICFFWHKMSKKVDIDTLLVFFNFSVHNILLTLRALFWSGKQLTLPVQVFRWPKKYLLLI